MTDTPIDLPVMEQDPDIIEDDENNPMNAPGMADAMEKAQTGQFESTMFQMWDETLQIAINQASEPLSVSVALGLLRDYPWLRHKDLPMYLKERIGMLEEAQRVLRKCFPKPAEELYLENKDDWTEHEAAYHSVLVGWTRASNRWHRRWEAIPLHRPDKGILHAVVLDASSLIIHPQVGLFTNVREMAGFAFSDAQHNANQVRIAAERDWTDDE
jgi:hypothetical protein